MKRFSGVFGVLPTPFSADLAVDEASVRQVVRRYTSAGVNGVTALGVMGEAAALTEAERDRVLAMVIEEAGGLPVVAGVSAPELDRTIRNAVTAAAAGAAAVMVSGPRMTAVDPDAIRHWFRAIADAMPAALVIQDYPQVAGYSLPVGLLAALVRDIGRVAAIKLEDAPSPPKVAEVVAAMGDGGAPVFGGLGGVYLLEELIAGAAGAMTGFAFPEALVEVVGLHRIGEVERAADRFYRLAPLLRFEFQSGIGVGIRKELLRRRGAIATAAVRPPNRLPPPETIQALDLICDWYARDPDFPWIRGRD